MNKKLSSLLALKKFLLILSVFFSISTFSVFAQTNTLYDFNTAGQLSTYFNGFGPGTASVSQSSTDGISNSGAISVPLSSVDAVYTTKEGYSLGPVGSSYTFQSFIKSEGSGGYSGMGFTTNSPITAATSSAPYRPTDAIGVSVHGGGFFFHNGATNYSGSWTQGSSGSLTAVKSATVNDLIGTASPDKWFKIVFKLTKVSSSTFNMRVEVWPCSSTGVLMRPNEADAIFEVNGVANTAIQNAAIIYSYFNFSGTRVTKFDNYAINLAGGASVIQQGAPVVLTSSASLSGSTVTVAGNVTSENGSTVTERGFVYGTSTNPTIANNKVVVGSGIGTFSGSTLSLAAGTYYFRAFATNGTATSYGSELSETIVGTPNLSSLGCITIVANGGDAENTTWTYSNNTIMPNSSTAVNINASDVLTKFALGNLTIAASCINVNENVSNSANANGITFKASGNIVVAASKSVTTKGGDIIFWSDSDASGTATTAGGTISLLNASTITTTGGDIVLAGGADANTDGIPDGYAIGAYATTARGATNATAGLSLDNASLDAATGNVILRGQGTGSLQNFQIGTRLYAGSILAKDVTIEAKGSIQGASSSNWGLSLEGFSIEGSGNIELTGIGGRAGSSNSDANQVGVEIRRALDNTSKHSQVKTIDNGTILINGTGGSGAFATVNFQAAGIRIEANQTNPILSANGSITLNGTSGYNGRGSAVMTGSPVSSANGNIILKGSPSVEGTLNLNGDIEINATITTGAGVTIESPGAVTQTAAITANSLGLNGTATFTLNNSSNNIVTLAGGNNTNKLGSLSFTDATGGLTVGTVGNNTGVTASGTVLIETLAGDLTLAENISTTNTTANAIVLNAGKSAAIGADTGGNIIVSGTPTLSTGTGGIAKLFSGSESASTGLTTLVGGSANTRSGVDETTTTFTPALANNTLYALYRAQNFVSPSITSFTPESAGKGESVVITGSGFTGATAVIFGNQAATSFVVNSDTQITAVVGNGASGSVTVTNPAGSAQKAGFIYKIVEYKFENNALDHTDANLDGTVNGGITYGPGVEGQSVCFDRSTSNWIKLPDNLIRNLTDFTISLRFKTSSKGVILGYQDQAVNASPGQYIPILLVQSDGKLRATLWTSANRDMSVVSPALVNDGNWHKVDMSITPNSINIYLDGVLAGTNSSGTIDHLSMQFNQLGRGRTDLARESAGGDLNGWQGFTGCIDNFLILDKGQTLATINQVTALPQPTITSFTPTSATAGQTLTLSGTNLSGATSLTIGGVVVTNFTVNSANQITFVIPNGNIPTNATIEVITAGGTASASGFTYINALPTLSSISDQVLCANGTAASVQFVVGDLETPVANLVITATSSNTSLLPVANISFTGNTGARTMNYATVSGVYGTSTVTLTLTDSNGATATETFEVQVAADRILTSSTVPTLQAKTASVLDDQIVINETGTIDGALVLISSGFVSGDVLSYTGTLPAGVSKSYNSSTGVLTFAGSLTASELQAIYRAVKFNSTANSTQDRTLTFTLGSALPFSANNHFYQFITASGISWTNAKAAAEQLSFFGKQGYLATVTSAAENQFIVAKIQGQGWMGASDAQTEGVWKWMTGPETGTTFWTGAAGGSAVNGLYNNWFSGEPNDYGTGEDYAHFMTDGKWNDYPLSLGSSIQGYVVEFGGMDNDPCVVTSANKTIKVVVNSAPTDISLSTSAINENNAIGAVVGNFSSTDADAGDSHTYTLVSGSGSTDNASFTLAGAQLKAGIAFDFESKTSYSVRLRTTDAGGLSFDKAFTITVNNVNETPTNLALSANTVNENVAANSIIGALTTTDVDASNTFTYTLVSGTGATDNAAFNISGGNLRITASPDFESKTTYSVLIRSTDQGGLSFDKAFTITVNNVNETPSDLALSANTINENNAIGAVIGNLTSTDVDAGDSFTYSLVSGDVAAFTISGAQLKAAIAFDFENKTSYSVRLRTTDAGGLIFEKTFTVSINNVNEVPTNITLSNANLFEGNATGANIGNLSSTDPDAGSTFTYSLVSGDVSAFTISGNTLKANTVFNFASKNSYSVKLRTTDAGGLSFDKDFVITISQVPVITGTGNQIGTNLPTPASTNPEISKGFSTQLSVIGSGYTSYSWSPATGLSSTNIANPIARPLKTTTYTLTVTNAFGNTYSLSITVKVNEDYYLTANNILTPNGDGQNDVWVVDNLNNYPNHEVKIFDRSGRLLYSTRNYQNNWNGQVNGELLSQGTVYYTISFGANVAPKKGFITIVR